MAPKRMRLSMLSHSPTSSACHLLSSLHSCAAVFHHNRGDFLIELAEHKVGYAWGAVLLRGACAPVVCYLCGKVAWEGEMPAATVAYRMHLLWWHLLSC